MWAKLRTHLKSSRKNEQYVTGSGIKRRLKQVEADVKETDELAVYVEEKEITLGLAR